MAGRPSRRASPTAAAWSSGCCTDAPITIGLPAGSGDRTGTTVSRTDHRQQGHAPMTLFTVHGGGHTIPGPKPSPALIGRTATSLHTARTIGEFFGFPSPQLTGGR